MSLLNRMESYKKHGLVITLAGVVLFLTLLSFQGFDVCDEGWYLTFYQQIFNNPETVEYNFAFWLTGIIGGLWYEMFPNGGILSFRILTTLVITTTFLLAYKILFKNIGNKVIVLSGLLMVLVINDFGYLAFYYNHLSSILALVSIYFILKGIRENNRYHLLITGAIVAINVFSRLPNITLFSFALIFPLQFFWKKSTHRYWINQVCFFILGSIVGGVLVFIVLFFIGHLDILKRSVLLIVDKGEQGDSNHNISTLVAVYAKDYFIIIKQGIKLFMVFIPIVLTYRWVAKHKVLKLMWYVVGLLLFMYVFKTKGIYTLYFIGLLGSFGTILTKTMPVHIKNLAVLALIMMLMLPLGSDGGIHNVGYVAVWLSVPLSLWFIIEMKALSVLKFKSRNHINRNGIKAGVSLLILGFLMIKIHHISKESYFDKGPRICKTYAINSPLASGVFTTEKRASIINELLPQLDKYVEKDDYLLAYDNIPMMNYLTNTKPYMYISWVWVYDSYTFKKQLSRAERDIEKLPIVLQQKFETIGAFSEPDLNYMSENKEETYRYKKERVKAMNSFLERNNYVIVWSNPYFNILRSE